MIWDVKLLLANAQTVQLVIISKMTACKLEVQNVIPSRKDAVQFKAPFGRAPAGSGSCTVVGCRPPSSRQVPTGAGAAEPEKRASPAPVVSVREERRREKNGSGEQ